HGRRPGHAPRRTPAERGGRRPPRTPPPSPDEATRHRASWTARVSQPVHRRPPKSVTQLRLTGALRLRRSGSETRLWPLCLTERVDHVTFDGARERILRELAFERCG